MKEVVQIWHVVRSYIKYVMDYIGPHLRNFLHKGSTVSSSNIGWGCRYSCRQNQLMLFNLCFFDFVLSHLSQEHHNGFAVTLTHKQINKRNIFFLSISFLGQTLIHLFELFGVHSYFLNRRDSGAHTKQRVNNKLHIKL